MISQKREGRASALIQKLAAEFIGREISSPGILITVSRIEISRAFQEVKIFVTIWPESREKEIMKSLENSKKEFYEYMKEHFKVKYMPAFEFRVDRGEKARQKVEEILSKENTAS